MTTWDVVWAILVALAIRDIAVLIGTLVSEWYQERKREREFNAWLEDFEERMEAYEREATKTRHPAGKAKVKAKTRKVKA